MYRTRSKKEHKDNFFSLIFHCHSNRLRDLLYEVTYKGGDFTMRCELIPCDYRGYK